MATQLQEKAFGLKIKDLKKRRPKAMGKIMIESGFSKSASRYPKRLIESKGWKELLAQIKDEPLLAKLKSIALGSDKRASIAAIQEIFKLKDKYPAGKLRLGAFEKERDEVTEER